MSGQHGPLLTICQEVNFAGKQGAPPAASCRRTQRRSPLPELILRDHPNSFPFIRVGREKAALPYCYTAALFQAVVFTPMSISSRTHFAICSSWCFSCEPT